VPRFAIAPLGLTTEGSTKFKPKGWKRYLKKLQCAANKNGKGKCPCPLISRRQGRAGGGRGQPNLIVVISSYRTDHRPAPPHPTWPARRPSLFQAPMQPGMSKEEEIERGSARYGQRRRSPCRKRRSVLSKRPTAKQLTRQSDGLRSRRRKVATHASGRPRKWFIFYKIPRIFGYYSHKDFRVKFTRSNQLAHSKVFKSMMREIGTDKICAWKKSEKKYFF